MPRSFAAPSRGEVNLHGGAGDPIPVGPHGGLSRKPCPEAVLALKLSGARVTAEQAYVTEAKVETDGGDSVFLEETGDDGWLVTAAGCRPTPDQEAPYDCEVES